MPHESLPSFATAWDHPLTRLAWLRHMCMNVLGLIGWAGGWIVLLGISTYTPNWVVWVFMPYFFYGFYRVTSSSSTSPRRCACCVSSARTHGRCCGESRMG